jgi:hypothetical protein
LALFGLISPGSAAIRDWSRVSGTRRTAGSAAAIGRCERGGKGDARGRAGSPDRGTALTTARRAVFHSDITDYLAARTRMHAARIWAADYRVKLNAFACAPRCPAGTRHATKSSCARHAQIWGGIMNTMLYPELYKSLESVRWDMEKDIPWDKFDASLLTDEQAKTIKMNAITEWSALPATEMFLRDNHNDSDFSAFMSVWFFEEQKHALVLMEYLRRFKPDFAPTEEELHAVRFEFDPAPPLETLMLHFCGEIRLNHWYRRAAEWHTEPVIKAIYETISRDEARHGGAYLRYMKKALTNFGDVARAAFAKIGVLMASARRTEKPLHPTNLHVNQSLFPRDTVQSRLPDPEWLERWLDEQIRFDDGWEKKVVERILHNLSILFERTFNTAQELNRYRKEVVQRLQAEQGTQQHA